MNLSQKNLLITNVRIVTEQDIIIGHVKISGGMIESIIADSGKKDAALAGGTFSPAVVDGFEGDVIDGNGGWLLPGFIDMHVHGGFGGDFMYATAESFDRITGFHASQGTTGMLATTMTASRDDIEKVLDAVAAYQKNGMPHAELLGVHLEGPFISEKWPGAQNPDYIVDPQLEWLQNWTRTYPGLVKMVTLAPEKPGSLESIAWLKNQGVIAAAGHTDAVYAELIAAADSGLTHAVHTYNAMRGLHHREPGTLGAVLTTDSIYAEIIADGEHVHPAAISLLLASKPKDKVILVTDAIEAAGMPDGEYELGGLPVVLKNGTARLKDSGALAGSSLSMISAFRFMVNVMSLSVTEASRMASGNPARELGLAGVTGSIAIGKRADLVVTDGDFNVSRTLLRGTPIFSKNE
ncbi:N-acetylglucosamine-6-phosphate deacetylase [Paenibacillus sp. CAU 1782]